ncbi:MAG: hypothetical protein ACTSUE_09030 [Promethearchaeota archaeon]
MPKTKTKKTKLEPIVVWSVSVDLTYEEADYRHEHRYHLFRSKKEAKKFMRKERREAFDDATGTSATSFGSFLDNYAVQNKNKFISKIRRKYFPELDDDDLYDYLLEEIVPQLEEEDFDFLLNVLSNRIEIYLHEHEL